MVERNTEDDSFFEKLILIVSGGLISLYIAKRYGHVPNIINLILSKNIFDIIIAAFIIIFLLSFIIGLIVLINKKISEITDEIANSIKSKLMEFKLMKKISKNLNDIKVSIKDKMKIPKELKTLQFKLFIYSFIFVLASYYFTSGRSFLRLVSLPIFLVTWVFYNLLEAKKEKDLFKKVYLFFGPLITLFLWLILLFATPELVNISVLLLLVLVFLIFSIISTHFFIQMLKVKGLVMIILAYIGFILGFLTLFAFIFSLIPAIDNNNELIYEENDMTQPWDTIYFSFTNFYNSGHGDIYPKGEYMKLATQLEVFFSVIVHIFVIGEIINNRKSN